MGRLFAALFLLLFALGCPVSEPVDAPNQGVADGDSEADVGDSDGGDRDSGDSGDSDVDRGEALSLHFSAIAHPAQPAAWLGRRVEIEEVFAGDSVEVGLAEGVWALGVGSAPEGAERSLRPLAGAHSFAELESAKFLLPGPQVLRLELGEESLVVSWEDEEGVGALFDAALATALDVEAVMALQSAVRTQGGSPVGGEESHFFFGIGSEDGHAPQLRGSFNEWTATGEHELVPLRNRLWGRFVEGLEGHEHYKVVYGAGSGWFTDFANPHIEWDGIDTGGVGAFNSVVHPEARPAGTGRLLWWPRVYSPELENEREVYVYLPPGYDESAAAYPLLIVHDGNESITRGRFHQVAEGLSEEVILAFVALPEQSVRMAEYTVASENARGEDYARFIAETLLPELKESFRVLPEREAVGVAGASLGGLISFYLASAYPDDFGFVAGMSSSFFWAEEYMLERIDALGCQELRYYIDSGSPQDNFVVTQKMRDVLDEHSCDYTYVLEEGGQHDWSFWRGRFDGVLEALTNF